MAYKPLTIIQKQNTTPLEISVVSRRLSVPISSETGACCNYDPDLDDSVVMLEDVGGIPADTSVGALRNKLYEELWTMLLFPSINPAYVGPSSTVADNQNPLQEIGASINVAFTITFSRGSITLGGSFQDYRSGAATQYNWLGYNLNVSTAVNTQTATSYTVISGYQDCSVSVDYAIGPQPLDSNGDNYGTPLAAGTTAQSSSRIEGVYPLFATSSVISDPCTKQTLVSMITGDNIEIDLVSQPNTTNRQSFDVPDPWTSVRSLTDIETYNTAINAWLSTGLAQWTTSDVSHNIQSNHIDYTRYTYNGDPRGNTDIRLVF